MFPLLQENSTISLFTKVRNKQERWTNLTSQYAGATELLLYPYNLQIKSFFSNLWHRKMSVTNEKKDKGDNL